jgi:hypothetical protein
MQLDPMRVTRSALPIGPLTPDRASQLQPAWPLAMETPSA